MSHICTIEIFNDITHFDNQVNERLSEGFILKSCNSGVASDNAGTIDTVHQAIMFKEDK